MKRWIATVVALVVAASVLSSFEEVTAASSAKPIKIVLIGDSYSAGNGARSYFGPKGCYRSTNNWAQRYSRLLESAGYDPSFVNRACSGAVTANVLSDRDMGAFTFDVTTGSEQAAVAQARGGLCHTSYPDEERFDISVATGPFPGQFKVTCRRWLEKQIDAIGHDTDLVLLTMGGNDVAFPKIVEQCFAIGKRDPGSCRERVENARDGLGGVQSQLVKIFDAIRVASRPDTRTVLLSYPYLSTNVDYVLKSRFGLPGGDRYEAAREVRSLGDQGDVAQRAAVNAANGSAGTPFVTYMSGIKTLFEGHEPDPRASSRNDNRWMNEFETKIPAEWYHMNPTGHAQVASMLSSNGAFGVDRTPTAGGDVDIVFVIDTTGSMGSYINAVKGFTTDVIAAVAARTTSARFAVVTYRDQPAYTGDPSDYAARVDAAFTSNAPDVTSAVNALSVGGGGDYPESVWSGLKTAIDLPWRPGVKKVVVQLGDAPPHDPEPISGLTGADVVRAAFEVDPAEVYVVDAGGAGAALHTVATETNGKVFPTSTPAELASVFLEALDTALAKPYAWAGGPYVGYLNEPVTFDASGSFDASTEISSYDWDIDGDGTYEATTEDPSYTHTYTDPFEGFMAVRVTNATGLSSIGSSRVHVSVDADEVSAEFDNCPVDHNPGQEDEDLDGIGDVCDPEPGYPVVDQDGVSESGSVDEVTVRFVSTNRRVTAEWSDAVTSGDFVINPLDGGPIRSVTGDGRIAVSDSTTARVRIKMQRLGRTAVVGSLRLTDGGRRLVAGQLGQPLTRTSAGTAESRRIVATYFDGTRTYSGLVSWRVFDAGN